MSDFENPYQSPETQAAPQNIANTGVQFTDNMLRYLNEASPWCKFLGILGYISAGFSAFSAIIGIFSMVGSGSELALGLLFLLYLPFTAIAFFPAHYLYTFSRKIKNYNFTNSIEDLEVALKNNKSFWKFIGILTIVFLALFPVIIILTAIFGVAAVMGLSNFF